MASGPITSWQTDGETKETVTDLTAAMKLKDTCFWKKTYDQS